MEIEFDPVKSEKNKLERGFPFELATHFEIDTALVEVDCRHDYEEQRFNALGLIGDRLYHMTYTLRGNIIRVISLRKANKREVKKYVLNN
ncbi:MAG: BrnT family toxin [Methylococcaceae bacterium]|nr:BrnT family toxin [Methylococcaceae bacterium]